MFVPLQPGQRGRQRSQSLSKQCQAIVIAQNIVDPAIRKAFRQLAQPIKRGDRGGLKAAQCAPTEIEDVTVQHENFRRSKGRSHRTNTICAP